MNGMWSSSRPKGLGGYSASPVAADGKIFLVSEDGKVAVLKAGRDWDVLAVEGLGGGPPAPPPLPAGRVYFPAGEPLSFSGPPPHPWPARAPPWLDGHAARRPRTY